MFNATKIWAYRNIFHGTLVLIGTNILIPGAFILFPADALLIRCEINIHIRAIELNHFLIIHSSTIVDFFWSNFILT